MAHVLLLGLLVAADRIYHPIAISEFPTRERTHVETCGLVVYVASMDDGDTHLTLTDGRPKPPRKCLPGRCVVAEITPLSPAMPKPRTGQWIRVAGLRRYDDEGGHKWWETNPVEQPWVDDPQCRAFERDRKAQRRRR